jgi:hypothetical protein
MDQWRVEACEATAGATEGPWTAGFWSEPHQFQYDEVVQGPDGTVAGQVYERGDRDFIAGSRTWVPRYEEALREAEAGVAKCRENHPEPFACYQLAEGGWTCADTERAERAEGEVERLRAAMTNAAIEADGWCDNARDTLRAALADTRRTET